MSVTEQVHKPHDSLTSISMYQVLENKSKEGSIICVCNFIENIRWGDTPWKFQFPVDTRFPKLTYRFWWVPFVISAGFLLVGPEDQLTLKFIQKSRGQEQISADSSQGKGTGWLR